MLLKEWLNKAIQKWLHNETTGRASRHHKHKSSGMCVCVCAFYIRLQFSRESWCNIILPPKVSQAVFLYPLFIFFTLPFLISDNAGPLSTSPPWLSPHCHWDGYCGSKTNTNNKSVEGKPVWSLEVQEHTYFYMLRLSELTYKEWIKRWRRQGFSASKDQ